VNVTANDAILLAHATFGVLGTLSALWVFVETLNARDQNLQRIRTAALAVAVFMTAAWICGGYWYLHFYPVEKDMILRGPWPFAHNVFMETKEHLFLMTLILSFYLPIAAWDKLASSAAACRMVLCVAALIALSGLAIEGSGAVIDHGVKVELLRPSGAGAQK
jgi:uncharacterized membrane protein YwaF